MSEETRQARELTYEGEVVYADSTHVSLQCHEGRHAECPDLPNHMDPDGELKYGNLGNGYFCECGCDDQYRQAHALDAIAEMLRDPQWGAGMLEDIAELVQKTGRTVDNYPDERSTWIRH